MGIIEAKNLTFSYDFEGSKKRALDGVSLTIQHGELVALLGHNGCGKSTLAKLLNALLPMQNGELSVSGLDARDAANTWEIRKACGMVFQNPDNQFVSSVVEEDLRFGPENYEIPEEEIQERIHEALRIVGMSGYERRSPQMLSGGQKQRIAIAGVLAVNPEILIFDEATAMLDPEGRREVLSTIHRLHKEEGKTILMISHDIEEAVSADRVVLIHNGKILAGGTPRKILTDPALLRRTGLIPPLAVRAYYDLREAGVVLPECPLTREELVESLCRLH